MSQRVFILGAGRFGLHLATRMSEYGCEVVLGDRDADRVKELAEDGFHALEMDVEDRDALQEAGVTSADVAVVCIGENMQGSILSTLTLKELKIKRVVARAQDAKHAQVLERVGADLVVLPSRDSAYHLAERLRDDAQNERFSLSGEYQLAHITLGAQLEGQTLAQAKLPQQYKTTVVLISRPKGECSNEDFEASADFKLARRDTLIVVGRRENINRLERDCGLGPEKKR
jgi:trk/ktr system potassium uptake protein